MSTTTIKIIIVYVSLLFTLVFLTDLCEAQTPQKGTKNPTQKSPVTHVMPMRATQTYDVPRPVVSTTPWYDYCNTHHPEAMLDCLMVLATKGSK